MLPHEGAGGWMPSPRNDSDASARIAKAKLSEAWTTIGVAAFGSTCRLTIHQFGAPSTRAASTYSRALIASTWPRIRRAKVGVYTTPRSGLASAVMNVVAPGLSFPLRTPRDGGPDLPHRDAASAWSSRRGSVTLYGGYSPAAARPPRGFQRARSAHRHSRHSLLVFYERSKACRRHC